MASKKINLDEAEVTYASANELRKGSYVLLRDQFPCKIVEMAKSKPGKHGSAKIKVVGLDIFSGKKYDHIFQSAQQICMPVVKKTDYHLLYLLGDNFIKIQAADGTSREDLKLLEDDEMTSQIEEAYFEGKSLLVTIISALNKEQVCAFKQSSKQQA